MTHPFRAHRYLLQDNADKSWFKRNAESIDLIVEENDGAEERVNNIRKKANLKNLQQELSTLLSRPLQPRSFLSKFLPGVVLHHLFSSNLLNSRGKNMLLFGYQPITRRGKWLLLVKIVLSHFKHSVGAVTRFQWILKGL